MKTYDLYLESGPKMRKTMVHVPALAGCTARGDTTNAALATTPAAIRAYLRLLARCGERADPDAPMRTRIGAHITQRDVARQRFSVSRTRLATVAAG